ncbi:TIGR00270 family protein, partial [Candidatus Micrarchaeota archaeon]|nr:TIGR00270 family protein [Candidatus Micrarchaeota archaeon]
HKINETEGFLDHIEKGKMTPTIALAKKLEKELKIKLIEKSVDSSPSVYSNPNFKEATLGDILEAQKKKK